MPELIKQALGYGFFTRALIVGALVALCAALLGVSLVLKKYSMIGDGLSHVGFGAMALASALNVAPLYVAIPVVVAAAFLLLRVSEKSSLRGDTSIALISTGSLAVGVMIVSLTASATTDLNSYMFGSILAMTDADVRVSVILCAAVLILFVAFYPRIFAVTFDESFARATGVRAGLYNSVIAVLTAVTIVLGMRMMGALLISSLIIFPPVSAMRLCRDFKTVVVTAGMLSVLCLVAGLFASFALSTPTGATIVTVDIFVFFIASGVRLLRGR